MVIARPVYSRTRVPSFRATTRKPSCLISWSYVSPVGGCGALVGRQGGTKPTGRGMAAYRAWVPGASNAHGRKWTLAPTPGKVACLLLPILPEIPDLGTQAWGTGRLAGVSSFLAVADRWPAAGDRHAVDRRVIF